MCRKRIVSTAIAAAFIAGVGTLGAAQTTGGPAESQAMPPAAPGSGTSGQNRSGGDYGPGGVPTEHQTTTQPSAPPSNAGSSTPTGSPGDHGPGGVPQKHETTTQPSGRSPADGGGAPDPGQGR
jgi:hypothetical protein